MGVIVLIAPDLTAGLLASRARRVYGAGKHQKDHQGILAETAFQPSSLDAPASSQPGAVLLCAKPTDGPAGTGAGHHGYAGRPRQAEGHPEGDNE
jgi:hypothetical protein